MENRSTHSLHVCLCLRAYVCAGLWMMFTMLHLCKYLSIHDCMYDIYMHVCPSSSSFACIGPSLWNGLPLPVRSAILSGSLSSSFTKLKSCLFHRVARTGSASERLLL